MANCVDAFRLSQNVSLLGEKEKPQTNNNGNNKNQIKSGFNVYKGPTSWRDYLISLYNYANYDYDEERNIKNRIDQSSEENKDEELNDLFYLILERKNLSDVFDISKTNTNTIFRLFCENLISNSSSRTFEDLFEEIVIDFQTKYSIPNDIKNSFQKTNFILGKLCENYNENSKKIEKLIELYAAYKPDMVDIVIEKKGDKKETSIKIKNSIYEDIAINTRFVSPNFKTKIENIKLKRTTKTDIKNFLKTGKLPTKDFLVGSKDENKKRLKSLIELYATYKPDMVKNVVKEEDGIQEQYIEIKNTEGKKITIKSNIFNDNNNKSVISNFTLRFKNIIKAISESIHDMIINRGQVQGNANSNTQNKPPSM